MSKKSTSSSSNITSDNNTTNINNSTSGSLYDTNIQNNNQHQQQQDFNDSINRSLDQTKDNINRSIEESRNQIPQYNNIVNSYQEQTLQAAREITENFIESQKTIIKSIQSAWSPYQQNINASFNNWVSPQTVANAYNRFVSNVAENTVSALRTTNNLVFASLDAYKTTVQHAKDTTKQIFDINTKAAQTLEQNSREVTRAAQDASSRFNDSINSSSSSSGNSSSSYTTSTGSNNTAGTTTSTTSSPAA
jgi:vacuolar-type H+-ATPase subunit H